jgi:hypothetical protein
MAGTPGLGTINTMVGRGEFGRGFYAQDSIGNAARRGQSLYGNNGAVLILDIDAPAYHALNIRQLTLNMAQILNAQLRASKTQGTYTTVHDLIVGPLVAQPRIEQQKFQSAAAGNLLNGVQTTRTVR